MVRVERLAQQFPAWFPWKPAQNLFCVRHNKKLSLGIVTAFPRPAHTGLYSRIAELTAAKYLIGFHFVLLCKEFVQVCIDLLQLAR